MVELFIVRQLAVLSTVHLVIGEPEFQEFCEREVFRASCKEDEVIVVTHGRYGRMREGRCISNYGTMACFTEVVDLLDVQCSGKRSCESTVATLVPDKSQPCPDDFRSYLEVAYRCVKVVHVDRQFCKTSAVIEIRQQSGHLSSLETEDTGCGSYDSPWWLSAAPGQRIRIVLMDFGSSLHRSSVRGEDSSSKLSCHVLVVLKEALSKTGESKTVCAETERERVVYTSQGSVVEARIVQRKHGHKTQHAATQFLLRFEAVGCPDLHAPKNGGIQKLKDEAILWCNESEFGTNFREQWRLKCVDNQWIGNNRNCTPVSFVTGPGAFGWAILDKSYSIPLLLILAIALAVGISMAVVGSLYIRHYRVRRQGSQSNHRSVVAVRSQRTDYGYGLGGGEGGRGGGGGGGGGGDKRPHVSLGGGDGPCAAPGGGGGGSEETRSFRPTSDVDSYPSSENDYYKAWKVQRPTVTVPPPAAAPPPPPPASTATGATAAAAGGALFPLTSYVLPVGDDQTEQHSVDHVYESPKFHRKDAV